MEIVLQPGTVLEGRYGVVHELFVGSSHRVYEGRQTNLGASVIIKTPREIYPDPIQAKQQIEQMRLEAHLLAGLSHPNLLSVFDVFVHDNLPILVCEYIDGRRLSEIVELAPKTIASKRVLLWAEQILSCLDYLHSQDPPVIARDLKPSNLILGRDGRLRLVDFGLVKRMNPKGSGTHEIVRGLGADGYAPLEQTAYANTGPASDLYALGATLYFLLTKTPPATASTRIIAGKDPLADPRPLNPTISDSLWQALQQLLALRVKDRPSSVKEARALLFVPDPTSVTVNSSSTSATPRVRERRCLDCGALLDKLERLGVEIDQCPKCGGIWLDPNELEQIIGLSLNDEESLEGLDLSHTIALASLPNPPLSPEKGQALIVPPTGSSYRLIQLLRDILMRTKPDQTSS